VVHGDYGGQSSKPPYLNDFALLHLDNPISTQAAQPVVIATEVSPNTTIAGYGYSNALGGTIGAFEVSWPSPVTPNSGQMSFAPTGDIRSAFCQGDSGGPVFSGRVRGCKPSDIGDGGEKRPRSLQGVISYNYLGLADHPGTEAQEASSKCRNAKSMIMQDITLPERRSWICRASNNAASGCR